MKSISFTVAEASVQSTVHVGCGILDRLGDLITPTSYTAVAVVADSGAARRWLSPVCNALGIGEQSRTLVLEGGEHNKDIAGLERLWGFFVEERLDRKSLVVSLGGGATSDLVGFAASTFMRGIACVNIPTTLLAQVDASIGGKTGINFAGIKNVLGSVAQPTTVIVDVETLETLPPRALKAGYAEILKHGLIADRSYWEEVTQRECTSWSTADIERFVFRSCEIKHSVVASDERETGPRKTLNFGHTVGHALEAYAIEHDISLTHGEAVSIGITAESKISFLLGLITESDYTEIVRRLELTGLPTRMPTAVLPESLQGYMVRDKKNVGGAVKWVLLESIGKAVYDRTAPDTVVLDALGSIAP